MGDLINLITPLNLFFVGAPRPTCAGRVCCRFVLCRFYVARWLCACVFVVAFLIQNKCRLPRGYSDFVFRCRLAPQLFACLVFSFTLFPRNRSDRLRLRSMFHSPGNLYFIGPTSLGVYGLSVVTVAVY